MCFCLLYRIYLTRIGRYLHNRQLRAVKEPHVDLYQTLHFGEESKGLKIVVVPFLEDNYGYILIDEVSGKVALVDPADFATFEDNFSNFDIASVDMIFTTHKHWDHAAANSLFVNEYPEVKVYGGAADQVDACTDLLEDGDEIQFGEHTVEAITTPCHTVGHTVYVIKNIGAKKETIAFTGDFLFMASCGMFFEGTPRQMQECFDKFMKIWPVDTHLLYGHEYALDDLKFSVYVDPENEDAHKKLEEVQMKKDNREIWLPGRIKEELTFNPFLRADTPSILKITEKEDKIDALRVLRQWKDDKVHRKVDKNKSE